MVTFFGSVLEKNSEPPAFIALNDGILECFGTTWHSLPSNLGITDSGVNMCAVRAILQNQ